MKNNKILMTIALLAMAGSAQPAVTQAQSAGGSGPGTFFERMGQKAKELSRQAKKLSRRLGEYELALDVVKSNQEEQKNFKAKYPQLSREALVEGVSVACQMCQEQGYELSLENENFKLTPRDGSDLLSNRQKSALLQKAISALDKEATGFIRKTGSEIQLPKLRSVPGVRAARYAATFGRSFNVGLFLGNLIRGNDILLDLLAKIKSLSRNKNFNWLQASKSKKARTLRALLTIARTLLIDQVIAARVNGTPGVLAAAGRAGSRVGSGALQWAKNRLTSSLEKKVL